MSALVQIGSNYIVAFVDLIDSSGNVIDTEAHLHMKDRAGTETVITRAAGHITYAAPSTDPDSGETVRNKYEAIVLATGTVDAQMRFWWHFPDIKFVSSQSIVNIRGPALTEPI
jgi:hypothetical protein